MKTLFIRFLVLASIHTILLGSAGVNGAVINPRSATYGARGDGRTDDTAAIQKAIDDCAGDVLNFEKGVYIIRRTLQVDLGRNVRIQGEPGAILLWNPAEPAQTTMIRCFSSTREPGMRQITGLRLMGLSPWGGPRQLGNNVGLLIDSVHHVSVSDLLIVGFDRAGLQVKDSYYCGFANIWSNHNGYGVETLRSDDSSGDNACHYRGLYLYRNLYGAKDVQSIIGGSVEASGRSGIVYTNHGCAYSLYDVWFEQNNTRNVAGEADIQALPIETNKVVCVAISGNTRFNSPYSRDPADKVEYRSAPTYTLNGCFVLSVNGAVRFRGAPQTYGSFNVRGRIIDNGVVQAMKDIPNAWVRKPEEYSRVSIVPSD